VSVAVTAQANDFGALVTGIDLRDLRGDDVRLVRELWLRYQVLAFPDQPLEHEQLLNFTRSIGEFGAEPYVAPLGDQQHILEIRREPSEAIAPFGASWHSDWSFQTQPPAATILHAKIIPPVGGDTLYADGYAAFAALDDAQQQYLKTLTGIHSARRPYSHEGYKAGGGEDRSMTILPSDSAWDTVEHPLVRTHPETGRDALWVNSVYTIAVKGMAEDDSERLLQELFEHATSERFVYRHRWQENMLTIWDNRSVQHCAQGGYDGHRRVLHRTTVAGDRPFVRT
jgi:taurine dioxygenase